MACPVINVLASLGGVRLQQFAPYPPCFVVQIVPPAVPLFSVDLPANPSAYPFQATILNSTPTCAVRVVWLGAPQGTLMLGDKMICDWNGHGWSSVIRRAPPQSAHRNLGTLYRSPRSNATYKFYVGNRLNVWGEITLLYLYSPCDEYFYLAPHTGRPIENTFYNQAKIEGRHIQHTPPGYITPRTGNIHLHGKYIYLDGTPGNYFITVSSTPLPLVPPQ
jgi:hypothetical protein